MGEKPSFLLKSSFWIALLFITSCKTPDGVIRGKISSLNSVTSIDFTKVSWNLYTNSSGQPCTTSDSNANCRHVGAQLQIRFPTLETCEGLSMTDVLQHFNWSCHSASPGVTFRSSLKPGKGLSGLVTASGWRPNSVILSDGLLSVSSPLGAWWTNPVVPLPHSPDGLVVNLNTAETIYVLNHDYHSPGYNINADGIGVVVLPGYQLFTASTIMNSCNLDDGEVANGNSDILICAGSQNRLWLEGTFDGSDFAYNTMFLKNVTHSRLQRLNIRSSAGEGLFIEDSASLTANFLEFAENSEVGLHLRQVRDLWANNIEISRGSYRGLHLENVTSSRFIATKVLNAGWRGIEISASNQVSFAEVMVGNSVGGVFVNDGSSNISFASALVVNVSEDAFDLQGNQLTVHNALAANTVFGFFNVGSNNRYVNIVSYNTTQPTLTLDLVSDNNIIYDLVSARASIGSIVLDSANNNSFLGSLRLDNPRCVMRSSHGNLLDTSCNYGPGTASAAVSNFSLDSSFIGNLTTNDATNVSDDMGAAPFANIMDWTSFDNRFRGWGRDVASVPPYIGRCAMGSCRIFDFGLRAEDTVLRRENDFVAGATCPSKVQGGMAISELSGSAFLIYADEILNDNRGDDDGLCESNEACSYAPHAGPYQGLTLTSDTCVFQDGLVSDVVLHNRI